MAKPPIIPLQRDRDYPIFEAGVNHGRQEMKSEILTILQDKYMGNTEPKTAPYPQAVLQVVRELVAEVGVLEAKKKKK